MNQESVWRVSRSFRLLVAREFENRAITEGLVDAAGFDALMATAKHGRGGRGPHRMLERGGDPIRLRPNLRGGVLARWLGDRHLCPSRSFSEFQVSTTLRERGLCLAVPVLAVGRRHGLFWHSAYASIDRPAASDGAAWLARDPDPARLRQATRALAQALRQFHDAGGLHGDLQLRNVLIEPTEAEHEGESLRCVPIDLDRTRIGRRVSPRARMRELARFARSLEKSDRSDLLSPRFVALAMAAYCDGDRRLRRSMLRWRRVEARRMRRHRVAWWLRRRLPRAISLVLVVLGIGCFEPRTPAIEPTTEAPQWSLLATGDTGRTSVLPGLFEGQLSVAEAMGQEAKRDAVDAVVLLGDNFYWHGLDRDHLVERIRTNLVRPYCRFLDLSGARSGEVEEACEVDASARQPVPIFAVLGNHDVEEPESIELERHAIPDFLPDWRMSESLAEAYEVAPGVSLILFESELAIRDEAAIRQALQGAVAAARGPWLILATHRPIATDDLGRPLPGGYPSFVREALADSGRVVQLVLTGHHHNLQAFEVAGATPSLQVGVGSGSRASSPLAENHPDARFGALELGFARVDLIGRDNDQRLSVRIFDAAKWPWLAHFRKPRLRAHFDVDLDGNVSRREPR